MKDIDKFKDFIFEKLGYLVLTEYENKKTVLAKSFKHKNNLYQLSAVFVNDIYFKGCLTKNAELIIEDKTDIILFFKKVTEVIND